VNNDIQFRVFRGLALFATLICGSAVFAQEPAESVQDPSASPEPSRPQTEGNMTVPCVQPAPLPSWGDYQGKFTKGIGTFARKLERKSVHPPHYKPGAVLCTLVVKDKFFLFAKDSLDPATFLSVGFDAGLDQAQNNDPTFGQGAGGYGKRFGADLAGQASFKFFKDLAYPTIFSEDPRYYRLAHGGGKKRILHALGHAFVAYRDDGTSMFNVSEWIGTTSAVVLDNTYHPGNRRGFTPAARAIGYSVLDDMGFDLLREFWPEIAQKVKLPFRGQNEPVNRGSNPLAGKTRRNLLAVIHVTVRNGDK
jgi:hypothetical protein